MCVKVCHKVGRIKLLNDQLSHVVCVFDIRIMTSRTLSMGHFSVTVVSRMMAAARYIVTSH